MGIDDELDDDRLESDDEVDGFELDELLKESGQFDDVSSRKTSEIEETS